MTATDLINVPEDVRRIAAFDFVREILITGESGNGKTVLAEMIQALSPRAAQPFVKVNCAELPASLVESELFGYEKGAFTGATAMKKGKFEAADGGTIFLDEIGELSRELQAKLLIVIEEKRITRVGGTKSIPVDVRIISATHQNLNVFRDDFRYRITGFTINIKPLRERKVEIVPLAQKFIADFNASAETELNCSDDDLQCLKLSNWSGNIRQLRDFVRRVCLKRLMRSENNFQPMRLLTEDFLSSLQHENLIEPETRMNFYDQSLGLNADGESHPDYWQILKIKGFTRAEQEFLTRYQELAVQGKTNDDIAARMGINRSTLFYRLKRIKNVIAGEENSNVNNGNKRWFYYLSRGLNSKESIQSEFAASFDRSV